MKAKKPGRAARGCGRVVWGGIGAALLMLVGGYIIATQFPGTGAQAAMLLRRIIGDQAVAQLETAVYGIADTLHQWEAQAGLAQASTPWADLPTPLPPTPAPPTSSPTTRPTPTETQLPAATRATAPPTASPPEPPTPTSSPTRPWEPAPIQPFTSMKEEGQWQSYIQDGTGQTVAYRTRLFPDLKRLYYAEAIVVAFNLDAVRLHFALGRDEPKSTVIVERSGKIPEEDLKAGHLLAAFNGGFLAQHGAFGTMANGTVILPAREGLGTVAIYADGRVRLGVWGRDLITDTQMVAWRQNGPLLIDNGQINPETTIGLPRDWGYSVGGETVIWRSALGLSADQRTLYYVAGPSLTLPILAKAVAATGAQYAMQFDINDYWVFFCTFYPNENDASQLETWPLHQVMRYKNRDRYLNGFERDFFYITSANWP